MLLSTCRSAFLNVLDSHFENLFATSAYRFLALRIWPISLVRERDEAFGPVAALGIGAQPTEGAAVGIRVDRAIVTEGCRSFHLATRSPSCRVQHHVIPKSLADTQLDRSNPV